MFTNWQCTWTLFYKFYWFCILYYDSHFCLESFLCVIFTASFLFLIIPGQQLVNKAYSSANQAFTFWCFSNYLTSCNSPELQFRLEVIKKNTEERRGARTVGLFSHSWSATGFNIILLSILGANLLLQINTWFFFSHFLILLPFFSCAVLLPYSHPLSCPENRAVE